MRVVVQLLVVCQAVASALDGFSLSAIQSAKMREVPSPVSTGSTKLYLFNGTNEVPGSNELLEFDTATKSYKTVAKNAYGQNDCLSASVVCGDTYYAVWTFFPAAAGVLAVDLKTGRSNYLGTGGQGYIYHALQCDGKNASSLLGFASKMGAGPGGSLQFQVVRLDTSTGNTTMIGSLPKVIFAGYDGVFRFTADGSEVYAAFPGALQPQVRTGNLFVLDTSTGKIKEHHRLPADKGIPYTLYPTGSNVFRAAFLEPKSNDITLCTVTKKSSGGGLFPPSVRLSSCQKTNSMWAGSVPMPVCGNDKLYTVPDTLGTGPGSPQPLTVVDLNTGDTTKLVDLSTVIPGNYIGTVACAP